jgi:RHS repeat-associated protein
MMLNITRRTPGEDHYRIPVVLTAYHQPPSKQRARLPVARAAFRIGAALLCACTASKGLCQSGPDNDPVGAQGYVQNAFHHSSVDSINLYNGQLTIPIALGPSYPVGPALRFQTTLTYNSRVYDYGNTFTNDTNYYVPLTGDPSLGIGWSLNLGKLQLRGAGGPTYVSPDGSGHLFVGVYPDYKTADATQFVLHGNGGTDPTGATSFDMWDGDGNHYVFDWHVSGYDETSYFHRDFGLSRDGWYLRSVTDAFLNSYTIDYWTNVAPCTYTSPCNQLNCAVPPNPNSWIAKTIALPSGDTIDVKLNGSQMVNEVDFPLIGGGTNKGAWTLSYAATPESFVRPGASCVQPVQLQEISGISLPLVGPTGQQYQPQYGFQYQTGLLTQMTVPTGATVQYGWNDYFFYHGRYASLKPSCNTLSGLGSTAYVVVSSGTLFGGNGPARSVTAPLAPGDCDPADFTHYETIQRGVMQRIESGPALPTSTTNYTQITFPYGVEGAPPSTSTNAPNTQTLTVAVFDDGTAQAALFWGSRYDVTSVAPAPGDRQGAQLRQSYFLTDPTQGPNGRYITGQIQQPACTAQHDYPFCPAHALRSIVQAYDYGDQTLQTTNRRLSAETTVYGGVTVDPATWGSTICSGCLYHTAGYTPSATWEANGRHYTNETHAGNLGNDSRTITTTWNPDTTNHLLNRFSDRTFSDTSANAGSPASVTTSQTYDSTYPAFLASLSVSDATYGTLRHSYSTASGDNGNPTGETICFWDVANPNGPQCAASPAPFGKTNAFTLGILATSNWTGLTTPWNLVERKVDRPTGVVTQTKDTAGLPTTLSAFDNLLRPTVVTPPGSESSLGVSYDSTTQTSLTRGGATGDSTFTRFVYDGLGRLIREVMQLPSAFAYRMHAFDNMGRQYFDSEWLTCSSKDTNCLTNTPSLGDPNANPPTNPNGTLRSGYDLFGRPTKVTRADGSTTTFDYSDANTTCSDTKVSSTTNVNTDPPNPPPGTPSQVIAATTTATTDAFGRVTSVSDPAGLLSAATSYRYNVLGKLTQVTQKTASTTQTRSFTYDSFGFLRSESYPELNGERTDYSYDALGNVITKKEAAGATDEAHTASCYDSAGRLLTTADAATQSCPHLTFIISNCYDGATGCAGGSYPKGKLTQRIGYNPALGGTQIPSVTETFTYSHAAGRLSSKTTTIAGPGTATTGSLQESWLYDNLGLPAAYSHARPTSSVGQFVVTTTYSAGLPVNVQANGVPVVQAAGYTPAGALNTYSTGADPAHFVKTTITPDASSLLRPSSIETADTSGNALSFSTGAFTYDPAGNITAMGSDTFLYDARSTLAKATLSASQSYTVDAFGNVNKGGTVTASTNRLSNGTYDKRGNLKSYGTIPAVSYDVLDRQATSGTYQYVYTAAGERDLKVTSGQYYYTLRDTGNRVAAEFFRNGATPLLASRDNVYLGNLMVGSYATGAVATTAVGWSYMSSDHLGTPRLITGLSGQTLLSRKYWPYGGPVTTGTDADTQRVRFAAMELESEEQVHRYHDHARPHDFDLGRFLSPDRHSGSVENPQSWNRYTYARNSPLAFIDPDGREEVRVLPPPPATLARWTPEQRGAENVKNAQRAEAAAREGLVVTKVEGRSTLRSEWEKTVGSVPTGKQIDHIVDRQLGGGDATTNGQVMDPSVNASNGVRTANAIGGLEPGTVITSLKWTAVGIANLVGYVGLALDVVAFSKEFRAGNGRDPNLWEVSRYLRTGDGRTDEEVRAAQEPYH